MIKSEKSFVAALLLCFFLGSLGIHRFYVGKVGTGILQLLNYEGWFDRTAPGEFIDNAIT